jgi:hypothetical protein
MDRGRPPWVTAPLSVTFPQVRREIRAICAGHADEEKTPVALLVVLLVP